jgi:hypothetical protein
MLTSNERALRVSTIVCWTSAPPEYVSQISCDETSKDEGSGREVGGALQRVVGRSYGWLAAGRGCSWLHHEPLSWNAPFTSLLLL